MLLGDTNGTALLGLKSEIGVLVSRYLLIGAVLISAYNKRGRLLDNV
jgi:hypothetical protein